MAKYIKLPDELKYWKITSAISEGKNGGIYKVSKKDYDGSTINAVLRNISVKGEEYNSENVDFIEDEAGFLQTVSRCGNSFNYIDILVNNRSAKEKIDLYIITEELSSLSQVLETKEFSENDIVDFGIQISSILESLESKNIFHGNLTPDNIYVTDDGKYKVGGFSDFESRISDFSFVAPEIYKKEETDFTTDIYSLGLIMYYMSNGNKLPFENDDNDKKAAIEKRMSGDEVATPSNGSDKLKSVIMIACKADNKYRWKNAANIKNALLSMKNDAAPVQAAVSAIPDNTEFDGNAFEEYDYTEFEEPAAEEVPLTEQEELPEVEEINENGEAEQPAIDEEFSEEESSHETEENNYDVVQADEESVSEDNKAEIIPEINEPAKSIENSNEKSDNIIENTPSPAFVSEETIDDEEIFDNFESRGKNKLETGFENKDYGSYFDEDDENEILNSNKSTYADEADSNEFDDDYDTFGESNKSNEKSKNKSKKKIIIIGSVIAAIAVIGGCIGFVALSGLNGSGNTDSSQATTQSASATTAVGTTEAPTTLQPTTVAPTTAQADTEVIPVVGYGYSYAKKLLEQAGFVVEIGEYRYSEEYPEGYVIAQSPEGNVTAKSGTVVTLDISSGLIQQETEAVQTEAPTEASTEAAAETSAASSVEKTNNDYIFPNSSTAYLSKSDVENLSADELNLAINEIYARNGRIFTTTSLADYFNSQSWYTPLYTADEFDKNVEFNEYEQANLQLLISYR